MVSISNLKIRVKLLLAFGSIILLSVILTAVAITSINKILAFKNLNEHLDNLSLNLERIELATKEFIYEGYKAKDFQGAGKSKQIDKFDEAISQSNKSLDVLVSSSLLSAQEHTMAEELLASKTITKHFAETQLLLKKRGFRDFGLEGSLRKAIQNLEKSNFAFDKVMMLTLRRHEKDFFLRKDLKYQEEFSKTAFAFREQLAATNNVELVTLLRNYHDEFNQVVEIEKQLGLSEEDGTKGKLFEELASIRKKAATLQQQIKSDNEAEITKAKTQLLITFFIQLVLATALAIVYAHVITKVIKEIRETMRKLAEGIFPEPLPVKTTEEIGQTKTAINQFLERLQQASGFAEKLGAGELTAAYDERYSNDVLAQSIISMQLKLREAESVQAKINWTNEGAARFNDILKNEGTEITMLGERILKLVTEYLNANQGALYVINEEERCFERIATYAYGKKKFVDEKLPLESGLLGQCALEKETIYLKEIPTGYVKITSGLGEATPNNVLITPLKIRGEVKGVLELASFEIFAPHQIEFVEKQGENIAAILSSRQVATQTQQLLEEAKKRQQELSQQEEEMRQHAEELQATQEEMQRQRLELEREVRLLKSKLAMHEMSLN
jgi:HAMP domain-containing protein